MSTKQQHMQSSKRRWEQVSLAAVAVQGVLADDDALVIDEYFAGLADERFVSAMTEDERAAFVAEYELDEFIYRASSLYADARVVAEYPRVSQMVYELNMCLIKGTLSKVGHQGLMRYAGDLEQIRTTYRHQRAAELRAQVDLLAVGTAA